MKKTLTHQALAVLAGTAAWLFAQVATAQTAVTVEQAGTLSSVLAKTESNIKVTGPLNGTDMKYLRDMVSNQSLVSIDLADATIVSGGEAYYDTKTTQNNVLGEYTFFECSKLTSVTLPKSIKAIGENAFARTGLREVEIPDLVNRVDKDAFAYCTSLKTVVLGRKVATMGQGVFYSSTVSNAYFKPMTPPGATIYEFSSRPSIHVYADALADYKASGWSEYGTMLGDLEKTHPYEKDPEELAVDIFPTYFDDALCTQLKAEYASMSDEDLTAQMTEAGLPATVIEIALKIKNNKWANYEKDFRIHSYKAYSDAAYWNDQMKATGGSYMGNPTGIYATGGENLYVFVGDDIPADATLYLAGCVENALIQNAQTGKKLVKGMNIVPGADDALYYVVYTANTKSKTKKLDEWPMMNIHIEGGIVNGYYELSRHSDADYKAILRAATHKRFTVKGDESLFHFKTATFRSVWPNTIDKSICWFDSLTVWQKELMGFCEAVAMGKRDFYPHNLSGGEAIFPIYYNNPNFAIEGEEADAGWANSSPFRTSYNSVACVKGTFNLEDLNALDDWCAAHECGHNNQKTISLEGCTEVSNNLFSNVIRFIDGLIVSVGTSNTSTMDDFVSHTPFYLRHLEARVHMYYQLYLYFHQARKNTAFFPTLFQELRKSPLTLYQSTNNNNGSLKFVRTVCKVAQQDLTDFFRAYGFFEAGKFEIDDYGKHTITVRQTDINKTLAEIAQYPTKNREILFIDDRISDVPAYGFPTTPGQKRRESEKIGKYGDLGQFTDFMTTTPSSYTYAQADSLYYMKGTGGVGFVVLDNEGQLLYGSNKYAMCIPSSIGKDFTIYSIDSDGTLHPTQKNGDASQVINMEQAGTMEGQLLDEIIGVKVTGPINGTDIKCLRERVSDQHLISLDLGKASIKTGGVAYHLNFRSSLNILGEQMFHQCMNLQYITLPEGITRVSKQALASTGITKVVIPDKVTTIEMDACAYCPNLKEAVIGEKVKTMGQGVFYSSPVKDVYVKPSTPPTLNLYVFSSNPTIHVHKAALAKYQASDWAKFGTIVDDLDEWEEAIANGIVNVIGTTDNKNFSVSLSGGELKMTGLTDETPVSAYTVDGALITKKTAKDGQATLNLDAKKNSVVTVSARNTHIKIAVKK